MKKSLPFAALAALLAAPGCGEVSQSEPGPGDRFNYPTGIGVAHGKLLVASSNFDLRYDDETGGSIISVDPEAGDALRGSLNIRSFAGEMAVADAAACGLPASLALVPTRGSNALYLVSVAADGALSCEDCDLSLSGNVFVDPFPVGIACGPGGIARAFVGHLRSLTGEAWVTQVDLGAALSGPPAASLALQHRADGAGRIRDFAYEPGRRRLWIVGGIQGVTAPLRWVDLGGDCRFDGDPSTEACRGGTVVSSTLPDGIELRSIALSHRATPPQRAFLTARRLDPAAAIALGFNAPDLGGMLLVADLVEDVTGRIDLRVVSSMDIGFGAAKVRVLPARTGRRDLVAALAADDGVLWIYDDETGDRTAFGRDPSTGAPMVGHSPFGLAVDPVPLAGGVGRIYVGSFLDSFVTPVDVPLDAPWNASIPAPGGEIRRITGGSP